MLVTIYFFGKILQCINWPGKNIYSVKNSSFEKNHQISKKNLYRGFFIDSNVPNFQRKEQIYRKKSGHFSSNSGDS
jgi:hypothetical protein